LPGVCRQLVITQVPHLGGAQAPATPKPMCGQSGTIDGDEHSTKINCVMA
jgi:hypothetical protein